MNLIDINVPITEGLRKTAQSTVQAIVRVCFSRLKSMNPESLGYLRVGVVDGPVIAGGTPLTPVESPNAGEGAKDLDVQTGGEETDLTSKVEEETSHIGEIDPSKFEMIHKASSFHD